MTDKKIEIENEIEDMILEHYEVAYTSLVEGLAEYINTEVQKAVEDGVRGFAEWIFQCPLHPDAEDDWVSDYLQSLDKGDGE